MFGIALTHAYDLNIIRRIRRPMSGSDIRGDHATLPGSSGSAADGRLTGDSGFRVQGSGFRVQGPGFRVHCVHLAIFTNHCVASKLPVLRADMAVPTCQY
eukprot:2176051-Rhodomonas_salina.1